MTRGRRVLLTVVKLTVVAALLYLVLSNVQWRDSFTRERPGAAAEVVPGTIVGSWDTETVRFAPAAGRDELLLQAGDQPDGSRLTVSPGFLTYVRNIDWLLFAAGAVCYFFSASFAALRWWWLLRVNRLDVGVWDAWRFTWIGVFFNNVVPGQTGGDVVKAAYIIKHCHGNRVAAGVSVIVDRVLGLASLALLAAVVVLFALDRFGELGLAIWGVLAGVALLGTVAFSRRLRRFIRLDAVLNRLPLSGMLKRIDSAVFFYRAHKTGIAGWMLAGMFNHVVSVWSVAFMGMALNVGMPLLEYFVLVPVINIASAVPLGLPNGWGVGEVLFGHLFATYGAVHLPNVAHAADVMRTRGVALSVLYRIHITLWSLLGGVLVLVAKDRVTKAEVEEELAQASEEAASATPP
jgi:uncharacterized protein (TIRG00374 family)